MTDKTVSLKFVMKYIFILVVVVGTFCMFDSCTRVIYVGAPSNRGNVQSGKLQIVNYASPTMEVWLNQKYLGTVTKNSCLARKLPVGSYKVHAKDRDGRLWDFETQILAGKCATKRLRA